MHRHLLLKAFEKVKGDIGPLALTHQAEHLSESISKFTKKGLGERRLRDYYNQAIDNPEKPIRLRKEVVKALCEYLDCGDLKKCKEKYIPEASGTIWELSIHITRKYGIYILLFLIISGFMVMFSLHKPKWMAWEEDHYVEVSFDTNKHKISELKLYDKDRVLYFKKITPDCETEFFKPDGLENLWYGKSAKGELEFFTALGKHPETGKTLKPITAYMIRKYICDTYK